MNRKIVTLVRNKLAIACFFVGLILTFLSVNNVLNDNDKYVKNFANESAVAHIDATIKRMQLYEYGLAGARGVLIAIGKNAISREYFKLYSNTRNVDGEFPGARGFGYIERVPQRLTDTFLLESQLDDWPNFTIKELNSNKKERFIIKYIEPVGRNAQAVGLDIASEQNRREAAWKAIQAGKTQLSGPITLVQATGKAQQSFLILTPLYENGEVPKTVKEREEKGYGWSYAPLIMEEVLADHIINQDSEYLSLSDVTDIHSPTRFYSSDIEENQESVLVIKQKHEIFGRIWEMEYGIKPAFVEEMHLTSPLLISLLGVVLSLLASSLVGTMNQTRQNRHQIIQEQAKLASIVENSIDGIIGQSLTGHITSWNKGAAQLFGFTSKEAIGKTLIDLVVLHDDKKKEQSYLSEISLGTNIAHYDAVRLKKSGQRVNVSVAVSPIFDEHSLVVASSVTCRDISVQKHNESMILQAKDNLEQQVEKRTFEVKAASNHLLMAAEVAELGIWSWEIESDKLTWNNQMYDIYDYVDGERPEELNYNHWYSRIHPEDAVETAEQLQNAVKEKGEYNPLFRIVLPNGVIRHIQAGAYIERDVDGNAQKVTGINRDITAQVEIETWLRHAKKQSDEASKAKSNFLANMSHEIRTPMNAVLGMLHLIQRTNLTRRQSDYAIKATSAASSLLKLLNDILDYSKIDAGKFELDLHPFQLESVMQELAIVLSGNQSGKDVEILFDLPIDIPSTLIGDRLRLQQILTNLTSNAFKFTEQGDIVLKVEEVSRNTDSIKLQFSVEDTGIGIHLDQMDKIFNGFSQADATIARRFGGSGLGLVISKSLIELMGGELQLESELGKGSTFRFSVEFKCEKTTVYEQYKDGLSTPLEILIIDDNKLARDVLCGMVESFGWQADCSADAMQALDMVRIKEEQGLNYDVILLDWHIPVISGIDFLEILLKRSSGTLKSKVIMVTALMKDALLELEGADKLPIVDVLSKPLTPLQLLNSIQTSLSNNALSLDSIVKPVEPQRRLSGLSILLVEDNALNRQVAMELLSMEGAEVDVAEGGIEGVAKATAKNKEYDVVLMDMQMPDIDGLEATKRIRQHSECLDLPILAMTANVSAIDITSCLDAGMNDHLGKPIEIQFVVERILFWTQSKANEQIGGAISDDIKDNDIKLDALQTLVKRFSGNNLLFQKALLTFEDDADELFGRLRKANEAANKENISAILHTFRGAASMIGALSAVEHLKYMESIMMKKPIEQGGLLFTNSDLDNLEVIVQISIYKLTQL